MEIRCALAKELDKVEKIYSDARQFMAENGNPEQWKSTHPCREMLEDDIAKKDLYVVCDGDDILGVFYYKFGADPTYEKIYDGAWLNSSHYGVIHRIAVAETAHGKGVASLCFAFGYKKSGNLKIDTHRDNAPMQRALLKNGFSPCGVIYLENGEERIAYQKA